MDKPPLHTLVPQRRGVGTWPVTLTTERANPLRRWNPNWGGCSTARRPVAAVNKLFLRRSVFVKRFGFAGSVISLSLDRRRKRRSSRRWPKIRGWLPVGVSHRRSPADHRNPVTTSHLPGDE